MVRGRFITIEGGEGVGKSTCIPIAETYLREQGVDVLVTREPGGTPVAERIRELLLAPGNIPPDSELLLIFAARAAHLADRIKPALANGQWVLCDRFTDATYAYQGGGRGISPQRIAALEDWVQGELRPDRTLLLDAPVETGFERARRRQRTSDRFEREEKDFYSRIRATYLARAKAESARFRLIDATQDQTSVAHAVRKSLQDLF